MAEHAPEPWVVTPPEPGESVQELAVKSGVYFVATVHDMDGAEANARLIAAAPELLTLAEKVEEGPIPSEGANTPEAMLRWVWSIRAAAAVLIRKVKATGEPILPGEGEARS